MCTTWSSVPEFSASALHGGMPLYKYISNRFLTLSKTSSAGKLSEYHTGYRAFSTARSWRSCRCEKFQRLRLRQPDAGADVCFGYRIGEVTCPTKYFEEASSINFRRSVEYGLGVLLTSLSIRVQQVGPGSPAALQRSGEKARSRSQVCGCRRATQPGQVGPHICPPALAL